MIKVLMAKLELDEFVDLMLKKVHVTLKEETVLWHFFHSLGLVFLRHSLGLGLFFLGQSLGHFFFHSLLLL